MLEIEADLRRDVLNALRSIGVLAWSNIVGPKYAGLGRGSADIIACVPIQTESNQLIGRFVALELKMRGGHTHAKREALQNVWLSQVRTARGYAAKCRSVEEAINHVKRAAKYRGLDSALFIYQTWMQFSPPAGTSHLFVDGLGQCPKIKSANRTDGRNHPLYLATMASNGSPIRPCPDCLKKWRSSTTSTKPRKGRACSRCGKLGHYKKTCSSSPITIRQRANEEEE
jgi:hypothetical protein